MKRIYKVLFLLSLVGVFSCQNRSIFNPQNNSSLPYSSSYITSSSNEKEKVKVTFINTDGTTLEEIEVKKGEKVSLDVVPSLEGSIVPNPEDSNKVLEIKGWDHSLDQPITQDTVFKALCEVKDYKGLSYVYDDALKGFSVQINDDAQYSSVYIPSTHSQGDKKDVPVKKVLRRNKASDDVIQKVFLGDNIVSLENSAFSGFHELTEIHLDNNLKAIPAYAFSNDKKLSYVEGFDHIETFGPSSFSSTGLTSVTLGSNVKSYENNLGGNKEAEAIFSYCANLKEVTIDNTLPIPSNMFSNCVNLEKVTLKNVPEIKGQAFFEDAKLSSLTLGEGLTSIGMLAFSENESLSSVTLPSTLQELGNFTFEKTGIESLTLPSSLTTVGRGILSGAKDPSKVQITVDKKEEEMKGFDEKWAYDYDSGSTYEFQTLK